LIIGLTPGVPLVIQTTYGRRKYPYVTIRYTGTAIRMSTDFS